MYSVYFTSSRTLFHVYRKDRKKEKRKHECNIVFSNIEFVSISSCSNPFHPWPVNSPLFWFTCLPTIPNNGLSSLIYHHSLPNLSKSLKRLTFYPQIGYYYRKLIRVDLCTHPVLWIKLQLFYPSNPRLVHKYNDQAMLNAYTKYTSIKEKRKEKRRIFLRLNIFI